MSLDLLKEGIHPTAFFLERVGTVVVKRTSREIAIVPVRYSTGELIYPMELAVLKIEIFPMYC